MIRLILTLVIVAMALVAWTKVRTCIGRPLSPEERESSSLAPPLLIAQASQGNNTSLGVSKSTAGAIAGALLGAGSGAIIGSHRGNAGPGAAIGAGLGAVGGYAVGHQIESQDQSLESVQEVYVGLHSLRTIRRMEAR
jgi:hypothetical protein